MNTRMNTAEVRSISSNCSWEYARKGSFVGRTGDVARQSLPELASRALVEACTKHSVGSLMQARTNRLKHSASHSLFSLIVHVPRTQIPLNGSQQHPDTAVHQVPTPPHSNYHGSSSLFATVHHYHRPRRPGRTRACFPALLAVGLPQPIRSRLR